MTKIYRNGEPPVVLDRGWVDDPRISFGALGVLAVLHALWSAGESLSYAALCERVETDEACVKRALDELEGAEYIVRADVGLALISPYERATSAALDVSRQEAGRE